MGLLSPEISYPKKRVTCNAAMEAQEAVLQVALAELTPTIKRLTAFYLNGCPYCRNAKAALAELVSENPAYGEVPVHWYEESESPDVVQGHSYYYVPSMFIGTEKLYEAQPGQSYDEIKSHVKAALDAAMA